MAVRGRRNINGKKKGRGRISAPVFYDDGIA